MYLLSAPSTCGYITGSVFSNSFLKTFFEHYTYTL